MMSIFLCNYRLCLRHTLNHRSTLNTLKFHTLRRIEGTAKPSVPARNLIPKRNFFWIFKKRTNREVKLIDKPPERYELIYRCGMDNLFLTFQYAGFVAVSIVGLMVIYQSKQFTELPSPTPDLLGEDGATRRPVLTDDNEVLLLIASFLFMFCLIHFFIGKMPVRIYCHPEKQKYLLYFYGPVPNQIKTKSIKAGELVHTPGKNIVPWSEDQYESDKTGRLIIMEGYFKRPADLHIMLGWQKDPNVNTEVEESSKTKSKETDDN